MREIHNFILDVQELMYIWTRGNDLFRWTNAHEFIVEWESGGLGVGFVILVQGQNRGFSFWLIMTSLCCI